MNNFIIRDFRTKDIDRSGYYENINISFKSTIIDIPMFIFDAEGETTAINSFLVHKIDPITHEICNTITLDSTLIKLHANGYFYLDKTNLSVLFDVDAYYYLEISNGNKTWNSQIFQTIKIPIATLTINSFVANDYIQGIDTELSAAFNATVTGKGLATFNFTWDFGSQQITTTIKQSVSVGDTVILNPTALAPSGVTSGDYTLTVSGSVSGSTTFNYTIPVTITVNKTDVSFDFNDKVKIIWGDGQVTQGAGTDPNRNKVTYTHTYSTVPQTLAVYNYVDGNLDFDFLGSCYFDGEISDLKADNAIFRGDYLYINNALDNNFNLDIRNIDMYNLQRLLVDNIKTLNAENSNIKASIFLIDSLRILTSVNVKNTVNLTQLANNGDLGDGILLFEHGNPEHVLNFIDFSGSALEQLPASANDLRLYHTKLKPENIIGHMYNTDYLYLFYNEFGYSNTYFDFTNYSNTLKYIYLSHNYMNQTQVDEYCKRIRDHAVSKNVTNGLLDITLNTAPSATGLTYINELVNNYGWTVNHD